MRAALWAVHSVEDFLLGVVGRTETVLSGKALAAHHAKVLHLDQQMRKAGLPDDLKTQAERIGKMLRRADPAEWDPPALRCQLVQGSDSRSGFDAGGEDRPRRRPRRLPEATVIDITSEI